MPRDKEKARAREAAWKEANKDHMSAYWKNRRQEKREELSAKQRAYYAANKDLYRDYEFRRRYGIGIADVEKLTAQQDGRCACCGLKKKKLFVDHCHTTMKVRGLLCLNCNTMIGHAHDNASRLEAGARYLRKSRRAEAKQASLPLVAP